LPHAAARANRYDAPMAASPYLPSPEQDQRHRPGPDAQPFWNESFWFPLYDPKLDIGIVLRSGLYPTWGSGTSNCYLTIFEHGRVVLSLTDQLLPMPAYEPGRLVSANGLTLDWEEPLQRFRLRFSSGQHGFDLQWQGMSPPFLYQGVDDEPVDLVPRHIEQGGRARGTVTIGGHAHSFDGYAHRDHTFGGERDWNTFYRWNYLSGEFDSFWFNAVRIKFHADMDWLHIGCLWDGERLLNLAEIAMRIDTADGGSRPLAADVRLVDETGGAHHITSGRICGACVVPIWNCWLKDYVVEYHRGGELGYGVLEHGYLEGAPLHEFLR
jgi:hypothetical protein